MGGGSVLLLKVSPHTDHKYNIKKGEKKKAKSRRYCIRSGENSL